MLRTAFLVLCCLLLANLAAADTPMVVAYQGYSAKYPENTMVSCGPRAVPTPYR